MRHLMRVFLTALLLLSAAATTATRGSEFVLVDEGIARAVIVVAADANQNTLEAATALQRVASAEGQGCNAQERSMREDAARARQSARGEKGERQPE
jgi:hypothetical protein